MRKEFVNEVARNQNVKRADLIEKDLILHQVLIDLSKNNFFHDNFAFKGGTCISPREYLLPFAAISSLAFSGIDEGGLNISDSHLGLIEIDP